MVRRKYWLKKVKETKEVRFLYNNEKKEKEEDPEKGMTRKPREPKKPKIDYEMKFQVQAIEDIKIDYTPEAVTKLLSKIVESRGRTSD
jgi:hypothetical protein